MRDGFMMLGIVLFLAFVFMLTAAWDSQSLIVNAGAAIVAGFLLTMSILCVQESVRPKT